MLLLKLLIFLGSSRIVVSIVSNVGGCQQGIVASIACGRRVTRAIKPIVKVVLLV